MNKYVLRWPARCKLRLQKGSRHGFTLPQILVVVAILGILGLLGVGVLAKTRSATHRAQCDARLKTIVLALDAFRQERAQFPAQLSELREQHYLSDPEALTCPDDPSENGSYQNFYARRAPRDSGELPILVCPFHEDSRHGAQAYVGRYTTQFSVAPANLVRANAATVQHPGENDSISATEDMELHGGDRIRTAAMGAAVISFQDGTTATLQGGSDVTVLQSFIEGQTAAPLYTLVRQTLGSVLYEVHHGSKFDVVTPTAIAGAHGTRFRVLVDAANSGTAGGRTRLLVLDGLVSLTTARTTGFAPLNTWISDLDVPTLPDLRSLLNLP